MQYLLTLCLICFFLLLDSPSKCRRYSNFGRCKSSKNSAQAAGLRHSGLSDCRFAFGSARPRSRCRVHRQPQKDANPCGLRGQVSLTVNFGNFGVAQNNQKISGTKAEVSIESECGLCESMSCLKSTFKIFESFRTISSISLNDLGSSWAVAGNSWNSRDLLKVATRHQMAPAIWIIVESLGSETFGEKRRVSCMANSSHFAQEEWAHVVRVLLEAGSPVDTLDGQRRRGIWADHGWPKESWKFSSWFKLLAIAGFGIA